MRRIILAIVFLCAPVLAHADSVDISPIHLHLSAQKTVTSITIKNTSDHTLVVQAKPKLWTQKNGDDVYKNTQELLVSPPIISIPAGSTQIVRVALMRAPNAQKELTYRVYLREIPSYVAHHQPGKVLIAFRIGVPVFVASVNVPAIAKPLVWRAYWVKKDKLAISVTNPNDVHTEFDGVAFYPPNVTKNTKPLFVDSEAVSYVLAGQEKRWVLTVDKNLPQTVRLVTQTSKGDVSENINIPAR